MKMPFGKYKGEDFEEIPTTYLQWIESELEQTHPALFDAAVEEMEYRDEFRTQTSQG